MDNYRVMGINGLDILSTGSTGKTAKKEKLDMFDLMAPEELKGYMREFFQKLMDLSKEYQKQHR